MNVEKILRGEFIGKKIKIVDATNNSNIGIEGEIIDETKNTFTIKTNKGNKKIIKSTTTIEMDNLKISGKLLEKRPEERIKIKVKS